MSIFFLYFFSFFLISSSIGVIFSKNPVYSVIYLISCFINASGLILYIGAEFLAVIFLLIYVGAIAVLFLFVVMMLDIKIMEINENLFKYLPISIIVCFLFFIEIFFIFQDIYKTNLVEGIFFKEFNYLLLDKKYIFFFNNNFENIYLNLYNNIYYWQNIQFFSSILYLDYFLIFWLGGTLLLIAMVGAISISLNKNLWVKRQNIYSQINKNEIFSIFLFSKTKILNKNLWFFNLLNLIN